MNERIKELINLSGIEIRRNYDENGSTPAELQKFAELIVRECASTAAYFSIENKRIHPDIDPREMPDANRMVYHSTCQCVANEIKEHFEVEE